MAAFRPRKTVSRQPRRSSRPAFNYYRGRQAETPTAKPPSTSFVSRLKNITSRTGQVLILLAVAATLIYSLMVKPSAHVSVDHPIFHDAATYKQAIDSQLHAWRDRNKVSFDQKGLIAVLQRQYPEIATADIRLPLLGQTPTIRLYVTEPAFILHSNDRSYLVNDEGLVVADASAYPALSHLPGLEDNSGFRSQLGKPVLDSSAVNFINQLLIQLKAAKVPVKRLVLPARPQELDLLTADRRYTVKFYLGGDDLLQAGQYLAARHQFDKQNHQPSQYLDVRVAGKVFYK